MSPITLFTRTTKTYKLTTHNVYKDMELELAHYWKCEMYK